RRARQRELVVAAAAGGRGGGVRGSSRAGGGAEPLRDHFGPALTHAAAFASKNRSTGMLRSNSHTICIGREPEAWSNCDVPRQVSGSVPRSPLFARRTNSTTLVPRVPWLT